VEKKERTKNEDSEGKKTRMRIWERRENVSLQNSNWITLDINAA